MPHEALRGAFLETEENIPKVVSGALRGPSSKDQILRSDSKSACGDLRRRDCVLETGEKGFEPLTFGFGDHCSTVGTTLLSITHVLKNI